MSRAYLQQKKRNNQSNRSLIWFSQATAWESKFTEGRIQSGRNLNLQREKEEKGWTQGWSAKGLICGYVFFFPAKIENVARLWPRCQVSFHGKINESTMWHTAGRSERASGRYSAIFTCLVLSVYAATCKWITFMVLASERHRWNEQNRGLN